MRNEIIVARYKEDLDWICDVSADYDITIYNKGAEIDSEKVLGRRPLIVPIKNSGRESDTYLRHILGKTVFSDAFSVFLQGDPFEHSPDIIGLLASWQQWKDLQPLSWQWRPSHDIPPPELLAEETAEFVGGFRVRSEPFSIVTWNQLQFFDSGAKKIDSEYRAIHDLSPAVGIASDFLRKCQWNDLAEGAEQSLVGRFSYGALFAVRGAVLDRLPKSSLELILQAANSHHVYGYVIERLWLHLCGEPFLLARHGLEASRVKHVGGGGSFVEEPPKPPLRQRIVASLKKRLSR